MTDCLAYRLHTDGNIIGTRPVPSRQAEPNGNLRNPISGYPPPSRVTVHHTKALTKHITARPTILRRKEYTDHPIGFYE